MRLADFILQDMEPILAQWETFASTMLPSAAHMDSTALRDHAQQILEAVAKDLRTSQTSEEQYEKSLGRSSRPLDAPETAAQTHAWLRGCSGFTVTQLTAEYRALRASVLRLWIAACEPSEPLLDDVIRFNEAIDQAIAESIGFFSAQAEQARNLLLGMLGHDMRSPLQTILVTASYLSALNAGETVSEAATRLMRSGARMQALLDDLCDFNRTRLGLGLNIHPSQIDLAARFADELDQLRAVHPERQIGLHLYGDLQGVWDGQRLQQVLGNLVLNAIKYGSPDTAIEVVATGEDEEVRFEVRNRGPALDSSMLEYIFDPLRRGPDHDNRHGDERSLGLGLYIASEIAKAHGGAIEVRSDQAETTFAVRLPRACRP
ncbi:HAMP domain-containing sensor histidine kinase [Cupriavidus necator]|uniref:sensor histidine kinase n=1 Tax=Cupriavidus necator TaxID=106590 RepID=UPI00339D5B98